MITYVTEVSRTFDNRPVIKQLRSVSAYISNSPTERGQYMEFRSQEEWSKFLQTGEVMFRYNDSLPFTRIQKY